MPAVHRIGDVTTGHGCPPGGPCGYAPPTFAATGSSDVKANGIGIVRQTVDVIVPHSCYDCGDDCDEICDPHVDVYIGNSTTFVNGYPIQVVGSLIACTPLAITGSGDVNADLV